MIRVITEDDLRRLSTPQRRPTSARRARATAGSTASGSSRAPIEVLDCAGTVELVVQYARRISDVAGDRQPREACSSAFGVLGGALLALLAGLATARRAMEPITAADRRRARDRALARPVAERSPTRSPTTRSPSWRARWRRCSPRSTRRARETEATLGPPARVRGRRLARAAHAAHLGAGQPRAARGGARGRAARGRRLRAALVAPDAPAGRRPAAARARRRRPRRPARAGRPRRGRHRGRRPSSSRSPATTRSRSPRRPALERRRRARRAAPAHAQPAGERAAPHRPGHRGRGDGRARATARSCSRSRTTGPASRPSCATRSSSASSAAPATAAARAASGSRSCAPSRESHRGTRAAGGAARRPRRALRGAPSRPRASGRPRSSRERRCRFPGAHCHRCKGSPCPTSPSQQLVVFSLGSEEYALPIGAVHEIIRYTEPRSVASEVAWIRGVIGLRGKIIPIFDLAARMELEPTGTGARQDRDRRDRRRPGRRAWSTRSRRS